MGGEPRQPAAPRRVDEEVVVDAEDVVVAKARAPVVLLAHLVRVRVRVMVMVRVRVKARVRARVG